MEACQNLWLNSLGLWVGYLALRVRSKEINRECTTSNPEVKIVRIVHATSSAAIVIKLPMRGVNTLRRIVFLSHVREFGEILRSKRDPEGRYIDGRGSRIDGSFARRGLRREPPDKASCKTRGDSGRDHRGCDMVFRRILEAKSVLVIDENAPTCSGGAQVTRRVVAGSRQAAASHQKQRNARPNRSPHEILSDE